jgi:long-chain acyl-CoA synthetase
MSNIVNELQSAVMDNQDATAIDAGSELSFSRLWSLTDRFAGGLRAHEISKGDPVGICLTDPETLLVAVYGTLRNGSVPVVYSPDLFDSEVADGLDEVGSAALVVDDRSPVSLISLSSSMRFMITVDIDEYFGMTYEAFLDNSGINPSGARTGRDLIERAEDDDALIVYGHHERELTARTYTHGDLREAAIGTENATQGPIAALYPLFDPNQSGSGKIVPEDIPQVQPPSP